MHLTLEQIYKIETYKTLGKSITETAGNLEKDKSFISRKISRNLDDKKGEYKSNLTNRKVQQRQQNKVKSCKFTDAIRTGYYCLKQEFSLEQIVGRTIVAGKEMVSHKRIYQYI